MRCKLFASAALLVAPFMLFGTSANAEEFNAKMVGFHEAPTSIFSANGQGTLHLDLDKKARTITFKETFSGLTSPVTQSHIHLGEIHIAGGVTVFFCTNLSNGPAGTQACPAGGGTITGTITGGNVIGLPAQGLPAGDFDALVELLESRSGYVNVHTTNFPAGEIRGQIRRADEEGDER
jgi:CHRD domain